VRRPVKEFIAIFDLLEVLADLDVLRETAGAGCGGNPDVFDVPRPSNDERKALRNSRYCESLRPLR
jgi:hypothetical protein